MLNFSTFFSYSMLYDNILNKLSKQKVTKTESKKISSVSEYLIDYLRTEIIMGGLPPGVKINEYHLSETLNVSRPILREVLRALESEPLVDIIPRKGSYVSAISLEDFIELYDIRGMIEYKAVDPSNVKK